MPTKSICIFLGSSTPTDPAIHTHITQVADDLATDGWDLVYGGSDYGLMGAMARIFMDHGRHVTGIIPHELLSSCKEKGILEGCNLLVVDDMFERKKVMMARSDAFLTLPGGIGTLDELTEALSHRYLYEFCPGLPMVHTKPVLMTTDDEGSAMLAAYFQLRAQQGLISPTALAHLHAAPWAECREHLRQLLAAPLAA